LRYLAIPISEDSVLKLAEIMVRKKFRNRPEAVEWLIDEGHKQACTGGEKK
jgi:hypothetical protein